MNTNKRNSMTYFNEPAHSEPCMVPVHGVYTKLKSLVKTSWDVLSLNPQHRVSGSNNNMIVDRNIV